MVIGAKSDIKIVSEMGYCNFLGTLEKSLSRQENWVRHVVGVLQTSAIKTITRCNIKVSGALLIDWSEK